VRSSRVRPGLRGCSAGRRRPTGGDMVRAGDRNLIGSEQAGWQPRNGRLGQVAAGSQQTQR
jgi:hypothetical protein